MSDLKDGDAADRAAGTAVIVTELGGATQRAPERPTLSDKARAVINDSLSDSTLENYRRWWDRFANSGGRLPTDEAQIVEYLVAHEDKRAFSTLSRWTVAINFVHSAQGHGRPCNTDLVRRTLQGIKNRQATRGHSEKRAKPLLLEDVKTVSAAMGESTTDVRDRAILMIGFACALRRSEIAAIKTSHLEFTGKGVTLSIPKSKTDQQGAGHKIGIKYAGGAVCPVRTLKEWLDELGALPGEDTVVFRRIDRWGSILPTKAKTSKGAIIQQGLTPRSVGDIIQSRCAKAGYRATEYSGHSLRAGLCTQAAMDGKPNWQIKKTSRHKSDEMLGRYVRDGRLYEDSAIDGMF
jgi:integrase